MNRKPIAGALVLLAAVGAFAASAATTGLKPGLWEMRVTKQTRDGTDMTAGMSNMAAQMQQAMANLPPERRAQMEAMMGQRGMKMGGDASIRMCVTPEMAKRDKPLVDRTGQCQPNVVSRSGDRMEFEFNCTVAGTATSGKGSWAVHGDSITSTADTTRRGGEGRIAHDAQ